MAVWSVLRWAVLKDGWKVAPMAAKKVVWLVVYSAAPMVGRLVERKVARLGVCSVDKLE